MEVTVSPAMADVPAGRVTLSDARTRSSWHGDVDSFEIGITPVTQGGYAGIIGEWPGATRGERLPVEGVSWWDAIRFCNALSDQAGFSAVYRIVNYGDLDSIGWYRDNSEERPHEVGEKVPNAWGLHDMLGNVWEWCWDFSGPERYGTYRAMRGGGWFDEHWSCRASVRRGSYPGLRIDDLGFRVARGALNTEPDSGPT